MILASTQTGYYQPAGPLISLSHGHSQPAPPLVKTQPADPPSSISPLPLPPHKIQPPSSTGDSSDNEVIITSVTTIKDNSSTTTTPSSRLSPNPQVLSQQHSLPPPPSNYRSPYHPSQPYQPATYTTYPPSYGSPYHSPYYSPYPPPTHHELCYPAPGGGYVTTAHHKYPPPPPQSAASVAYRRYLNSTAGGGYYVTTAPEMFGGQGPGPGNGPGGQSDPRAVAGGSSGASSNGSSYQTASPHQPGPPSSSSQGGQGSSQGPPTIIETYTPPPPPSALLDSYPHPPPSSHYYPGYGPAAPPPPSCYTHPHASSRGVPFLNATYPPCPCPMQSCPKNVHTGPLTGDCKRSTALQIAKATTLPPVALALPLEPASATGPPSPARGSAGMPPPPSPAGATYQTLPLSNSSDIPSNSASMQEMLPQLKNEQISDSESSNPINSQTQTSEQIVVGPSQEETIDVKPTEEKRRKARVGKAMVRNSIQQQQMNQTLNNGSSGNTMLLMCNPSSDKTVIDGQTTLITVDVKREVESPEEIQHHQEVQTIEVLKKKSCIHVEELIIAEDLTMTKEPPTIPNGHVQVNKSTLEACPVQLEPVVIQDVKTEKIIEPLQITEVIKPPVVEILEPCQKTVAENVKVKNMKRKLSFNNNNLEEKKVIEESPTAAKKSKQTAPVNINNNVPNNGSYKDLIKKGVSTVKINNGKRKLISNGGKLQSKLVPSKFPKKRTPVKRKASIPLKDETNSKRVKLNPKPLATNNSKDNNNHPAKNNEVKENTFIDTSLIENKEPPAKPKTKNGRKNAAIVNQSEIIKTNVDRTIESVVNHHNTSSVRTEKPPPTRSRSRSNEKQKELIKDDKLTPNVVVNNNINTKRNTAVKTTKSKVTELVPIPPVITVSNVLIPSAVPSVESFLKPSVIPKVIASTSKSHLSVPSTSKTIPKAVASTSKASSEMCSSPSTSKSDLCCAPSTSGTSKQSVVRRRKGVPPLSASSVAAGTRSLKASAALAASVVVAAAIPKTGRRSLQQPRWSNGWRWEGEPFQREVFLNSDDTVVLRKCYPAMRHREGDTIEPRDCVLLKAGPRKNDLPFVAKVAALWENPEDGEMMMSLLWYYRPEHTEQGRTCADQPDEVFASRHKDSNSVACIEDKCYVLTFNEYCRYRKTLKRLEEGLADTSPCIPLSEPYQRDCRQPPRSVPTSPEMIFFCRRVYDFRQKRIVKNPS